MKTKSHILIKARTLRWNGFATIKYQSLVGEGCTEKFVVYKLAIPGNHRVPLSYHKLAEELVVFVRGSGTAYVGRARYKVAAGDTLFIKPGTPHGFSTGNAPMEIMTFLSPRVDAETDFYHVKTGG